MTNIRFLFGKFYKHCDLPIAFMFTWQTKKAMLKAILSKNSPFYIQFYVSKRCHLNCRMCNIVKANADVAPFEAHKIDMIAENLIKIGAGVVLLTGGEPFLRPDIDQIVRAFKARKLDVRLQTAGLLKRKETIFKCFDYGACDINVSLDSLDEKLSDYINGVPGSWKTAIRMISYLSEKLRGTDSVCALGCVLSAYNVDEIEAVLDFATRIGWWLSLVPVHITSRDHPMNFRGHDESFNFKENDLQKVKPLIDRLKKKKKIGFTLFDSDDYLDSMGSFITEKHAGWRHKQVCDSPNLYFAILPDGKFAPCCDHRFKEDVYVYDPKFPEIYRSGDFRKKVLAITEQCAGCHYGSFPEMTLSVRSLRTLKERLLLQMRTKNVKKKPFTTEELLRIANEIRNRYEIYRNPRNHTYRKNKNDPGFPVLPKSF